MPSVLEMRILVGKQRMREEDARRPSGFAWTAVRTCDLFRPKFIAEKIATLAFGLFT